MSKGNVVKQGEVEQVYGIDAGKLDVEAINDALERLELKGVLKSLPEKVLMLKEHFTKTWKAGDLLDCTNCGGASPETFDRCPYCGEGDDAPGDKPEPPVEAVAEVVGDSRALAPVEQGGLSANLAPAPELDKAVEEIRTLLQNSRMNAWRIATKLRDIGLKELWKQRKTVVGKVAYSKIEDFAKAELGMHRKYAQMLQRLAGLVTEQDVRQFGPTKLSVVVSFEDKDLQKEMLDKVRQGATRRELEQERGKKTTNYRGKKNRKSRGGAQTNAITVAQVAGLHKVKLYARKQHKADPRTPAKTIKDMPHGHWDMVNDVRMIFAIVQNPAGELYLNVEIKRVPPVA